MPKQLKGHTAGVAPSRASVTSQIQEDRWKRRCDTSGRPPKSVYVINQHTRTNGGNYILTARTPQHQWDPPRAATGYSYKIISHTELLVRLLQTHRITIPKRLLRGNPERPQLNRLA